MGRVFVERSVIMLLVVFLAAGALLATFPTEIAWRWRLVQLKTRQQSSLLTWSGMLSAMAPGNGGTGPAGWVTGQVRLEKLDELDDPCPAGYAVPTLGLVWGRLTDDLILEFLLSEQTVDRAYMNDTVTVRTGDVVLDVGGHLGTFTRAALNNGASHVITFEPEPTNHACIKKTLRTELQEGRVTLIEAAAMDSPGTVGFQLLGDPDHIYSSARSSVVEGGKLQVRAVTIDQTVEDLGLKKVDFVKMDIEGGERRALEGARRTIAQYGPRMALAVYHSHHPDHEGDDQQEVPRIVLAARPTYVWSLRAGMAYFFEPDGAAARE